MNEVAVNGHSYVQLVQQISVCTKTVQRINATLVNKEDLKNFSTTSRVKEIREQWKEKGEKYGATFGSAYCENKFMNHSVKSTGKEVVLIIAWSSSHFLSKVLNFCTFSFIPGFKGGFHYLGKAMGHAVTSVAVSHKVAAKYALKQDVKKTIVEINVLIHPLFFSGIYEGIGRDRSQEGDGSKSTIKESRAVIVKSLEAFKVAVLAQHPKMTTNRDFQHLDSHINALKKGG